MKGEKQSFLNHCFIYPQPHSSPRLGEGSEPVSPFDIHVSHESINDVAVPGSATCMVSVPQLWDSSAFEHKLLRRTQD